MLEIPPKSKNKKIPSAQEKLVHIPEKANIDLYLGVALPLRLEDELYLPTFTLIDMLGGGFAAHLMQTVRERDGLTYGISARLSDFGKDTEGSFRVWSTLSPLLFEKGLKTIRKEITTFFNTGITEEALVNKKDEISGSYVIGLSTTHGLASQLHSIGIREKELSYIDEYPELIRKLTIPQLKKAAEIIPLNKLSLSAAGTFPE
jgi:zinc protease